MTTRRRLIDTRSSTCAGPSRSSACLSWIHDTRHASTLASHMQSCGRKETGGEMTIRYSILALSALLTTLPASMLQRGAQADHLEFVDATGNLRRPADCRARYQALGVDSVLDTAGNEMHHTYATPGTAEFYRENKRFADGTVLVKEVLATSHARLTTGDAHWAEGTKVWFVMIKDEK